MWSTGPLSSLPNALYKKFQKQEQPKEDWNNQQDQVIAWATVKIQNWENICIKYACQFPVADFQRSLMGCMLQAEVLSCQLKKGKM